METTSKSTYVFRPVDYLMLAFWFGLATGLLEAIYYQGRKVLGYTYFLFMHQDFFWMTTVANVAVFLVFGLIFFVLARFYSGRRLELAAVFTFTLLLCLCMLLRFGRQLHDLAKLMLAIGLAAAFTRNLGERVTQWMPAIRRTALLMIILQIFCGGLMAGKRYWNENREYAELPKARPKAPNVLILTWDTVRADHCSIYGYKRATTPHLEKWAKKGVTFNNALATAPWTLPSHASMFTGKYPHEFSATWVLPLDALHPTLAEVFRDQGYETAGFVANRFYCGRESGLQRGFLHFEDYSYQPGEFISSSVLASRVCNWRPVRRATNFYGWYGHVTAEQVNDRFFNWLERRDGDRPFFVFMNYFDSHDPYLPPPPFDRKFGPPPTSDDKWLMREWYKLVSKGVSPDEVEKALQAYDGGIAYQDHHFDILMQKLQKSGVLDNTLVIVTGDHGEHFGEHGFYMHGHTLYRDNVHVPLVMMFPKRVPAGKTVENPVTLRDMAATVVEVTQAKATKTLPGSPWSRYWSDWGETAAVPHSPVFQLAFTIPECRCRPAKGRSPVASGNLASLVYQGKYYIKNIDTGVEELFDFVNDPDETKNLVHDPAEQTTLQRCREALDRIFQDHESWWLDFP